MLVRGDDHRIRRLTNADAARSELIQHADLMSWSLRVYHRRRFGKGRVWQSFTTGRLDDMDATSLELTGDLARRAFAAIIPAVNQAGATKAEVRDAVELVVSGAADPVASLVAGVTGAHSRMLTGGVFTLQSIAPAQRLALEMSLHEADERAALEGELHVLEARWREAEEIAAISDGMFLPSDIDERLDRLRGR
ncbi:MAG: hypothetical protein IPP90_10890 [Gemmatimonadaceae bacterium]|nr:hypothetical protein [Gemmatimonadaceae bacterium]